MSVPPSAGLYHASLALGGIPRDQPTDDDTWEGWGWNPIEQRYVWKRYQRDERPVRHGA